jgi:hypothetical protein
MYLIGGHIVNDKGMGMSADVGFTPFLTAVENRADKALLTLNAPIFGKAADEFEIQYEFRFDDADCRFGRYDNAYFLSISSSHGKALSVKIEPKESGFQAFFSRTEDVSAGWIRFAVWTAFGTAAVFRQTVAVHASVVVHKRKAILFLGESGTGKSTHTRLWLQYVPETELLNDDSPFLRVEDSISVYGSPWSGKTPCYRPLSAPVVAIVRLRQSPANSIRRLRTLEAIGALLPSCPPQFACDGALSAKIHNIISETVKQIPIYMLDCLPDKEAVDITQECLFKTPNS